MQIKVQSGDVSQVEADAIVVNLFEGITGPGGGTGAVDSALDGAISKVIADGGCRGKEGELTLIHSLGKLPAPRVVVAGLGKAEKFSLDKVRSTSAGIARYLRRLRCRTAATITHGAGIAGLDPEACAQAIAEGTVMGLYQFKRHKKADEDAVEFAELSLVEHDSGKVAALESGVGRGVALADATNFARDLANEPSNVLTPTELAARASSWAKEAGLEVDVFDKEWMTSMKMGALLGVAQGSAQPPKFIVIRYQGGGDTHLALVGKGITFDTGGISIKPAAGMEEMKGDMTGAASVIAAMGAIGRLKPVINVTAIAPCTENMPSGTAIKPGDVLYAMTGTTIEVLNTDAEGRLILADGLGYAMEQQPDAIVDVATLTGAISIALGNVAMGAMTNSAPLYQRLQSAATAAGEKVWELPMFDEYRDQIKSDVADIKNTGGRGAGSITAAFFLKEFVGDTPWVHLDIAGVDFFEKEKGVTVKGASGIPVRTLVHLALELADKPL